MNLTIQFDGFDVQDDICHLVEHQIGNALRMLGPVQSEFAEVWVELKQVPEPTLETSGYRRRRGGYRAEVTVAIPGTILGADARSTDVRRAVARMKQALTREIHRSRPRTARAPMRTPRSADGQLADRSGQLYSE